MNELSKIFALLDIDTTEVLEAAGTKWNFLPFRPGIVGGHCIGVDPYYLTHKAQTIGYHPQIILAGRRLNDGMGQYIANEVIKLMIKKEHKILNGKILVLGVTFKENCPDIRNSRVIDIIRELKEFECNIDVYDPWADKDEVRNEYGIEILSTINSQQSIEYDAVILAVAHEQFRELDFEKFTKKNVVIYDVKSFLDRNIVDKRL
jgi:UDP-N-acetyl-D-galactosamine dehydrogenase